MPRSRSRIATSPCWSARGRAVRAWNARIYCWRTPRFFPPRAKRWMRSPPARGTSAAASAASAALDHVHDWMLGTPPGDWVSMAVTSDGSYGIPEGVIYSYPVTCKNGEYSIVQGLSINDFSREKMQATHRELLEERDGVKDLI